MVTNSDTKAVPQLDTAPGPRRRSWPCWFRRTFTLGGALLAMLAACQPDIDSLVAGKQGTDSGGTGAGGTASTGGNGGGGGSGGSSTSTGGTMADAGAAGETQTTTGGAGAPPKDSCEDGRTNSGETDTDCGGSSDCDRCDVGDRCVQDSDCTLGYCATNRCEVPTCSDGVQNQNETAVDCGGGCAPAKQCSLNFACKLDRDCKSGACSDELCIEHCESGKRDSSETDVDCGGAVCDPCGDNKNCEQPEDCQSSICDNGKCQPASCDDGVANQNESDIDCGGSCAPLLACDLNEVCNAPGDCESYICSAGRCSPDLTIEPGDMIDDMEDGNQAIIRTAGRDGGWYAFGDGVGTHIMEIGIIPGQRGPNSVFGTHHSGSGFDTWGAGVGFDLKAGKQPYDASSFNGISFWARSEVHMSITIAFPDANTDPTGGLCTSCDHHWFTTVGVEPAWKRFTILFEDLLLEDGTVPTPTAPDLENLLGIHMRTATSSIFDVWYDDIAFIRE